jgi:hypothetical protein
MAMYQHYINSVERYRWVIIIAAICLIAVASQGLSRIAVLSDYKAFMDEQDPRMLELQEVEAAFTANHNLVIAIAPDNKNIFSQESIKLIQWVTQEAWQFPYAFRVDSISNYQHTTVNGDDLLVGDLFPIDEAVTPESLENGLQIALNEPSIVGNLIGKQQHVAVVSITFEIPAAISAAKVNEEVINAANQLIAELRDKYSNVSFYLTGVIAVDHSMGMYMAQDSATLIPGMMGLMAIILLIMTRSISGIVSASMVVVFTGVGTMGLLGWSGWAIDPGSAISPIVIMTLAVADSIHIIEGVQSAMWRGIEKTQAVQQSLKENFMPVFITSLTTVMGVATFVFAELQSIRRLGITVALGVSIAFLLSITLLPALLSVLPMKVAVKRSNHTLFESIGEFSIRFYRWILVLALIASVALISQAGKNRFNDSPAGMLALSTPERKAIDFYEDNVSGIIKLDVGIFTDHSGHIYDPLLLAKLDQFANWLRAQPSVAHVSTITDTFKRLNQNMHNDDSSWYKLPGEKSLAAQYMLLYEMSLPYGLDLNNQLDIDKSATRMTVVLGRSDSQQIMETKWEIEKWFKNNADDLRVIVTGTTPMLAELSYVQMIPSMMKGGIIAVIMVSSVLLFVLRRIGLGLVAMIANLIPVATGYGLWYLLNGQVNFAVASVAGVCLGVVVDFAVHFLSKYQMQRKLGATTENAIRYAFMKTGRPLWTTMVVLVAGFWLLMLSPITMSFGMGSLTGIIIMLALAFDFLVLPALLLLFDKKPIQIELASKASASK